MKPNNVWSEHFKLEVFIWRHIVYVPKSFNNISRNFIFVVFRPRDMQEYISMFSIALAWTVNSICDNQISNWCREIFKYNTVIS